MSCWANPETVLPKANFYISVNGEQSPGSGFIDVSTMMTSWFTYGFYICIGHLAAACLMVAYAAVHHSKHLYNFAKGVTSLAGLATFVHIIWGAMVRFGAAGVICSGTTN